MISQIPIDETNNFLKLRNKLIGLTGKAITDFNMIENQDRVLVCMSGGKDSYSLLMFLLALKERVPIHFDIIAMNLDQKQPDFPVDVLPKFLKNLNIEYQIITEDTYSVVKEKIPSGKTTCSLCSRLRRGIIYRTAKELNINKIALGHHRDDIVETLFLNMFFGSKLKAMPPKLISNDSKNIIIRPLAYCSEKEISSYASRMNFPIIPCNLCGSQENLQRKKIKKMLLAWEREYPGRINNIYKAISNVEPSHLGDRRLYDFENLNRVNQDNDELIFTEDLIRNLNVPLNNISPFAENIVS